MSDHQVQIHPYRVCYGDTDQMGRVYHANYFVIAERARAELFRSAGFAIRALEENGLYFPIRRCHARYRGYAVYDDLLVCLSYVGKMSNATISIITEISKDDQKDKLVIVTAELACIGNDGKPRVISEDLFTAIASYHTSILGSSNFRRDGVASRI